MVAPTARLMPRTRMAVAVLLLALTALPFLRNSAQAVVGDKVAIGDVSKPEASGGGTTTFTFTVTLTNGAAVYGGETVAWTTEDGTAKGGADCATTGVDFVTSSGTLTFDPVGTKTKTIDVLVCKDSQAEPNEAFTVKLSSETNPTLFDTPNGDDSGVGTISNDDGVAPAITGAHTSASEGNSGTTPMTWTLNLSSVATGPVTVGYSIEANTAATPGDYVQGTNPLSGTLTFASGESAKTLNVNIVGDTVNEGNEIVHLKLSAPSNATLGTSQYNGTILDDDTTPVLTLDPGPTVAENSGPANFTVKLNPASGREVTVNFTTANGTASSPGDFAGGTQKVTFAPSETTKVVPITIVDDANYEGEETFSATISGAAFGTVDATKSTATAKITDNESAPSISIANATGSEGSGKVEFIVSLTKDGAPVDAATPVTVGYQTSALTAKPTEDYTEAAGTVTIPVTANSAKITVVVTNDTRHEDTEKMKVTLSNASGAVIDDGEAEGTITDGDNPPTIVAASPPDIAEGNTGTTPLNFTVKLSAESGRDAHITYATGDTTSTKAASGVDYAPVAQTLVIPAGSTEAVIPVSIYGDVKDEENETFKLTLTPGTGVGGPSATTLTGTIADDDAAPTVSIDDVTVQEGNTGVTTPAVFTVTLSNPSGKPVTVKASTADDSASAAGNDYTAQTLTSVVFAEGEVSKPFTVNVKGDAAPENNEQFKVNLTSGADPAVLDTGTGTIADDDGAVPVVSVADASGNEGDPIAFAATLSNPSTSSITVSYITNTTGTATSGTDYTAITNGSIVFPANSVGPVTIPIQSLEDPTDEPDETFTITLSNPTPSDKASIGRGTATGTIVDDDGTPVASVSQAGASFSEGVSSVIYTVTLNGTSDVPVTIKYATTDGSAKAGQDYTAKSGELTIPKGSTSGTVSVALINDALDENDENFTFSLTDATNATLSATANTLTTTIVDNDASPAVSVGNASVTEGDTGNRTATFTVTLAAASARTASVLWATQAGDGDQTEITPVTDDATADTDYATSSGVVTFLPGELTKTVTVPVIGDNANEATEYFRVVLSEPDAATLGTATGMGTILDDDAADISVADVTAAEGAGTLTFVVTLAEVPLEAVSVDYFLKDGSGSSPADWGPKAAGTLNFAAGDQAQDVVVPINEDALDEANESFFIVLENAVNATITDSEGKGTITDNDDPPALTVADETIEEGTGGSKTLSFTLTLSAVSGQTAKVAYATANDTATSTADYTHTTGTATFAPGETTKQVQVPIKTDSMDEVNETFFLVLSSPSNLTMPETPKATGTITDDDALPTLKINDIGVKEPKTGTANAVFTISLSSISGKTVKTNWKTVDGTAKSTDYSVSSGTATIPPGSSSVTIVVPVKADSVAENAETFSVQLSLPTEATYFDAMGVGTITDSGRTGYLITAEDGGIFAYGDAVFYGSIGGKVQNAPVVGMAWTPDHNYYWQVGRDGGIFSYGVTGGRFFGSAAGKATAPVVGMASTASGKGYWIASADGNVYNFGDAPALGNMFGKPLNKPIVTIVANRAGTGYYLIASDGGVFNYNSPMYGSLGNIGLVSPIVGAAVTQTGGGYYMVAKDGGVFAFGDGTSHFFGSMAGQGMNNFVGIAVSDSPWGYRLLNGAGEIYGFGTTGTHLGSPAKSGLKLFLPASGLVGF